MYASIPNIVTWLRNVVDAHTPSCSGAGDGNTGVSAGFEIASKTANWDAKPSRVVAGTRRRVGAADPAAWCQTECETSVKRVGKPCVAFSVSYARAAGVGAPRCDVYYEAPQALCGAASAPSSKQKQCRRGAGGAYRLVAGGR